eukprot:4172052-Pyramimonas_sp.AAC.1
MVRAFAYMGASGASSSKPTALWSNDKCIGELEAQGKKKQTWKDKITADDLVRITHSADGREQ